MLTALCQFYPHIFFPILWSFICFAYVLFSVWYLGYQLFGKETAHADQHSAPLFDLFDCETQFDLWILHASTHTRDLEDRWEKDIINSARNDMYILKYLMYSSGFPQDNLRQ